MKTIPMIFNSAMVQALLDGRKVQTRRPIKQQPSPTHKWFGWIVESSTRKNEGCASWETESYDRHYAKPPCKSGDLIYVRETFAFTDCRNAYRADKDDGIHCIVDRWIPSIHMPRSESRLTLNVTGVRVESVQDITEDDAKKEGMITPEMAAEAGLSFCQKARGQFKSLWCQLYGESWDRNDWVWVIDFEVINKNIDQYIFERAAKGEVAA